MSRESERNSLGYGSTENFERSEVTNSGRKNNLSIASIFLATVGALFVLVLGSNLLLPDNGKVSEMFARFTGPSNSNGDINGEGSAIIHSTALAPTTSPTFHFCVLQVTQVSIQYMIYLFIY